jgi:transposase
MQRGRRFCGNSFGGRRWFFIRLPRCLVGMEACATAHYWARELRALGHEVRRLMPAQYVKAYVKRNKNDAADAEAIWEAVARPTMRFVPANCTAAGSDWYASARCW